MKGLLLTAVTVMGLLSGGSALDRKVASVLPRPDEERWLQIPWRLNLMQARADAQAAGKPLFLWIMNGHPLGCT
jgi:hypothetical protein